MDYLELVKTIVGKLVKIIEYLLSRTKKSKKEKEPEESEKNFKRPEIINKENINEYMEKVIKEIENEPDSDKNLEKEKEKEFFGSKISDLEYKISSDSSL